VAANHTKTAVLLAGGIGSRLRPLTTIIPKPLVPIGDQSIAEILIEQLAHHGFGRIHVSIGHLGHLIEAVLGDGSRYGVELRYHREDHPLGTIGPLALVADDLPENFLLLNGDVLSDLDFSGLLNEHIAAKRTLTIATFPRQVNVDLGVLEADDNGEVTAFVEKPRYDFLVSMGVYAMSRGVLGYFKSGNRYDFDKLVLDMLQTGDPIGTFAWGHGRWLDIGRHVDYEAAQDTFNNDRHVYLPWRKAEEKNR
jgi:NDP-mannose synthase